MGLIAIERYTIQVEQLFLPARFDAVYQPAKRNVRRRLVCGRQGRAAERGDKRQGLFTPPQSRCDAPGDLPGFSRMTVRRFYFDVRPQAQFNAKPCCGFEGGHRLAAKMRVLPAAGIEAGQYGKRRVGDPAFAAGGALKRFIVDEYGLIIGAQHDVEFDAAIAVDGGGADGGERVLRGERAAAAVGDHPRVGPRFHRFPCCLSGLSPVLTHRPPAGG